MAFVQTDSTDSSRLRRSFSLGPVKLQVLTYTAAAGDLSASITADALAEISQIITDGSISQTAAATISGNTATLTIAVNPATGTVSGTILVLGI